MLLNSCLSIFQMIAIQCPEADILKQEKMYKLPASTVLEVGYTILCRIYNSATNQLPIRNIQFRIRHHLP